MNRLLAVLVMIFLGVTVSASQMRRMAPSSITVKPRIGPTKTVVVPFNWSMQGEIILPVKINGQSFHMALDTGATHTWVFLKTADALHFKKSAPDETLALGCKSTAWNSEADIEFAGLSKKGFPIRISDDELIDAQGMLGEDFLQEVSSVTIDYRRSVLILKR